MTAPIADHRFEICESERAAFAELVHLDRREIKTRFANLRAPAIGTLDGEFDAQLLSQGGAVADRLTARLFKVYGPWIGKAFSLQSAGTGIGYNCFRYSDSVTPKLPMQLKIGPSRVSAGESLILDYRTENRGPIRWLVGEVRSYTDSILLGFGTFGPKVGKRDLWRRKIPFALIGPVRAFQYDQRAAA